MPDELLPYYEKELAFIRQMGAEFAKEHPKIAGRLGINAEIIEDPHVARLIESFAYLNARIQHKLDDDFPELSDALLEVMFPHYQRPIPSMSIVQFVADQEKLDSSFRIEKQTLLDTEQFKGESCRFTTVYDTQVQPFEVAEASLLGRPFATPGSKQFKGAGGVLKLSLQCFTEDINFAEERPDQIRFYLKGQPQHINPLYELLLNQCLAVYVATNENDPNPVRLPVSTVRAVGFTSDEGLLPYPRNSFMGYRLLTEYFAFPEKFMFFDLQGFADKIPDSAQSTLEFYLYLSESDVELEHNISAETFQLNCTPVINLFHQRSDPIKLDHGSTEYEIVADARRPNGYEVYSVETVTASTSSGSSEDYLPLYGINHENQNLDNHAYWFCSRRHAKLGNNLRDEATDVFLSLVDLQFNPNNPDDRSLSLDTICSNRNQPARLPFGTNQPRLQCVDSAPPCSHIRCLTQPSPGIRPSLRNNARWRLISHLSLNHLSITGGGDALEALKEILRLYDFKDSSVNRAQVESISKVTTRSISAPITIDGNTSLCRGIEVEIELDELQMSGSSSFLFASVLEHFFALYCSINSFTRVLVRLKNKEGYLKKCPPRAGEKTLL
ncbi:MAG: type VI secretion system baseplate subunit TssF [Aestuariibacter sp.]|nr:type VI secretion system baseplate subunit TssF [Aestuariibacter sp.]